jgi:hypothetical protein
MRTSVEEILSIKKHPHHFEMLCYIKDHLSRAIRFTFPYGAVEHAPQITPAEHQELRAANRGKYGAKQKAAPISEPPLKLSAKKQQQNELSLRDIDLPLPETRKASAIGTPTVTSIDANGRIDKSLRLLTSALRPLIEKELRQHHGDNWRQQISIAIGSDPDQPLDPYAALKTMLDNWQSCFKNSLKIKTRTDISKALEARNAISHASDEIPPADAISYLTSVRDIAIAISAKPVTDTLNIFIHEQFKIAATTATPKTHESPQSEASTEKAEDAPPSSEIKPGKRVW